ncbi:BREX-1 system phosphatase PglZ type B [Stenotrophomonas sp. STM01]|uniref:BREX-1 system phosphatase PglZ type B n=1 Tax=Stenotrophomonas sp. STM01 TaxID=2769278 RepID=UPI001CE1F920|nr:BREX-1 system phosphatase PglZ type B [Stenotrophomonas sp. STM01]
MTMTEPSTPLQALAQALRRAQRFNQDAECAPHCILWPDKDAQWRPIIGALQAELPELLVLGSLDEARRTGPGIWLRCAMAGQVPAIQLDGSHPPILYLPEVGRQDLRAIEHCPDQLRPLAELQYRGQMFSQVNAKDWTVLAFLKSEQGGLGLDVGQDKESKESMLLALGQIMDQPLEVLRARRLDGAWFNTLLTGGDPVRDLLQWMDAPAAFRAARDENAWAAFLRVCQAQFAFQPKDGELAAAAKLAARTGTWQLVWERFAEAPVRYPNIPAQIRRSTPPVFDMLTDAATAGGWPQWNDAREADLRASLKTLFQQAPHDARAVLRRLEREHRHRRDLVWATLGEAPLAMAMAPLARLAEATGQSLETSTVEDMQTVYVTTGWQADDAVLRALEHAISADSLAAITAAIRSVYLPWMTDGARRLQELVSASKSPGGVREGKPPAYITRNQCVMFVDGLRFDLGRRLIEMLDSGGLEVAEHPAWTALPSVTATGKAAVAPVAERFGGRVGAEDFVPGVAATGAALTTQQLRKALTDAGWQLLTGAEVGVPGGQAWCEFGDIDQEGHTRGWKLALHAQSLLAEIAERISALLAAGWEQVRVVTDHGWLLLPGNLPKVDLPKVLTSTKWGRCAVLKEGAHSDERLYPWYWDPAQLVALADGVACYKNGEEYAHGGLSLQECLVLQLTVTSRGRPTRRQVRIGDMSWKGLRLSVSLEEPAAGASADVRLEAGDSGSSVVVTRKPFSTHGACSLIVEDEDLQGREAYLVIVDADGALLSQRPVTVGVNE